MCTSLFYFPPAIDSRKTSQRRRKHFLQQYFFTLLNLDTRNAQVCLVKVCRFCFFIKSLDCSLIILLTETFFDRCLFQLSLSLPSIWTPNHTHARVRNVLTLISFSTGSVIYDFRSVCCHKFFFHVRNNIRFECSWIFPGLSQT